MAIYNVMLYARINLDQTNYVTLKSNWQIISNPDPTILNQIYYQYCKYKKFSSVMPIFDSEYQDQFTDVIGYFDNQNLVAFSLIKKHDELNVEAIQFAWTYHNSKLRLGMKSLEHECAYYKSLGYKFLYLGEADEYKSKIEGFEILKGF